MRLFTVIVVGWAVAAGLYSDHRDGQKVKRLANAVIDKARRAAQGK